jgi:hypothetical protein
MGRGKDQFIRETGGFRFGESEEQFHARVAAIQQLRKKISDGKANAADVDKLAELLGTEDEDDED